jgi:hypothetical protein
MASVHRIERGNGQGYGLDDCDTASDTAHPRRIPFAETKSLVASDAELASGWDACIGPNSALFRSDEDKGIEGVEWGHIESRVECDLGQLGS